MLFSAILYYLWEAMLISYLAARVTVLPFTGIETLVANSDFKIAVNPNSYQQSVFENSVDPIWQTAWQDRIKPNMKYYVLIGMDAQWAKNGRLSDTIENPSSNTMF